MNILIFNETVKCVALSASRALGLVIVKCKSIDGLPYNVYTRMDDSIVWPTISYGAAIWARYLGPQVLCMYLHSTK